MVIASFSPSACPAATVGSGHEEEVALRPRLVAHPLHAVSAESIHEVKNYGRFTTRVHASVCNRRRGGTIVGDGNSAAEGIPELAGILDGPRSGVRLLTFRHEEIPGRASPVSGNDQLRGY